MQPITRVDGGGTMQGLPHAIQAPRFRKGILSKLRRSRERKAPIAMAPTDEITHCRLCGSPHKARANHFCPKLYGR
jgi:hypothetical protein